jgi:RND family efflux transporter MFP subunit
VLIEEGMVVEDGQLLARLDPVNDRLAVDLATAQLEAARVARREISVRIHEAELDLVRVEQLVAEKVVSQADLDGARAEVDSLVARLASQEQQVAVAERQLALARQQLADTEIRAPFAGVVVSKDAQPGEMISPVSAGGGFTRTGIGTVVDMSSLEIEVDVNESYINRVAAGQPVVATLDSYPDWRIPARVIAIVPTADRQKATVRVRIAIDAADPRILPDMGVKVAFQGGGETPAAAAVVVPKSAVRDDGGTAVVLVVKGERVERRAVRLGPVEGEEATVTAGLASGEVVVVGSPVELVDGDRVEAR